MASPVVLLVTAAVMGRSLWFFSDDWNIYADYHSGNLLEPFNGHLSAVPAGLYQVLFHTVGMGSYWPYRLCGLVALGVLAFQVARFTHHRLGPWAAAFAVTAVMWNSAGSTNVLFPFLMNFSLPIAALLAVWWHLDRRSTGHDAAAAAWLALALATSGLGVMALAAAVVELAVSRAPWRRWAVLSPGVLVWAGWYLTHRDSSSASTDVGAIVAYCGRMFLGGTTSLAAGWTPGGVILAGLFIALLVVAALRWRSLDARSLGALAAPAAFIVLTAVTRLAIVPRIPPDELRYRWAIAAYLVAAVVVIWRPRTSLGRTGITGGPVGADEPPDTGVVALPRPVLRTAGAVTAVVLALGAVQLLRGMQDWTDMVSGAAPGLRSNLFAVEAVGPDRIDPGLVLPLSYVPVTAGGYLGAVADVGSPIADQDPATFGGRPDQRTEADGILVAQLPVLLDGPPADASCTGRVDPARVPPGSRIELAGSDEGLTRVRVTRFTTDPAGPADAADGTGPAGGAATDGTGTELTVPVAPGGARLELRIPADAPDVAAAGRTRPYRLDVSGARIVGACPGVG